MATTTIRVMPTPLAELLKPPRLLEDRIRQRAYEIYLSRDGQSRSDVDDWLQAEEELRNLDLD